MICERCRLREAFSEVKWARFAEQDGPPSPPVPPGMCLRCAFKDPALREQLRPWMEQLSAWADQRMASHVRRVRELAARPLEAIDRFVESLR